MYNFGHPVASSTLWFKGVFIGSIGSVKSAKKITQNTDVVAKRNDSGIGNSSH